MIHHRSLINLGLMSIEIVLMPDSCEEVFPFVAKEISEGEVAANFPLSELDEMDLEDFMVVKFVLTSFSKEDM